MLHELQAVGGRLESVVTFTVVQFTYNLAVLYMARTDILMLCVASLIGMHVHEVLRQHSKTLQTIYSTGRQLTILVGSQVGVDLILDTQKLNGLATLPAETVVRSLSTLLVLLVVVSVVPVSGPAAVYCSRSCSLILYIFADATENVLARAGIPDVLSFVCAAFYVAMHRFESNIAHKGSLVFLLQGVNMVCVNVVLSSVAANRDPYTKIALLLLTLMLMFTISRINSVFEDTRGYAMWKTAQRIFLIYKSYNIDFTLSTAFAFILVVSRSLWPKQLHMIFELAVLVAVNIILDIFAVQVLNVHSSDRAALLFIYVITVKTGVTFLQYPG